MPVLLTLVVGDILVGGGTLALAVATFALAGIAFWQLRDSRNERRTTEKSLAIAEATLQAQQRPELIALQAPNGVEREVHLATYGAVLKPEGEVWVRAALMNANVGLVSFEARNIGPGGAEITRVRLMSLDTLPQGGAPAYWEPDVPERRLIVVPASGIAPVDLVMAPTPPSWFYNHLSSPLKLWVEITYQDLGAVETYVRWFEFQQRYYQPYPWFISQVLRSEPQPFKNLPPANPLIAPI
jgi:hypothetical protein